MIQFSLHYTEGLGLLDIEIVERKGKGHPDTLADSLAERLSAAYAKFTLGQFGVILHHNFDKLALLGGATEIDFGSGRLSRPIRIILNGRATESFAGTTIPVRDLLEAETRRFFSETFGDLIQPDKDLNIQWFVSNASSPGKIKRTVGARAHMFSPRTIQEVKGYDQLVNNDTSMGCGYAPLSPLENTVLQVEAALNNLETKKVFPWLGTDIKVMATRNGNQCGFTLCLPQIARHVGSISEYQNNLALVRDFVSQQFKILLPDTYNNFQFNTRDDYKKGEFYLTATGSSIESGDEGVVGRGNRINGLITPFRPMNLEGVCGKNPKYHTGKLYNIAAHNIAERLHLETGGYNEVFLVGQSGQPLLEPWSIAVRTAVKTLDFPSAQKITEEEMAKIPNITEALVYGKARLF